MMMVAKPVDQSLSPLLADLVLDTLATSRAGAHINSVYVGAPMFANDLALVADSPTSLQY